MGGQHLMGVGPSGNPPVLPTFVYCVYFVVENKLILSLLIALRE